MPRPLSNIHDKFVKELSMGSTSAILVFGEPSEQILYIT